MKNVLLTVILLVATSAFAETSETFSVTGFGSQSGGQRNEQMACFNAQHDAIAKAKAKCESIDGFLADTSSVTGCQYRSGWFVDVKAKITLDFNCAAKGF